jgi:hypothetical protein
LLLLIVGKVVEKCTLLKIELMLSTSFPRNS